MKPKLFFICKSFQETGKALYEKTFMPFLRFSEWLPYKFASASFKIMKTKWFIRIEVAGYAIHVRRLSWGTA